MFASSSAFQRKCNNILFVTEFLCAPLNVPVTLLKVKSGCNSHTAGGKVVGKDSRTHEHKLEMASCSCSADRHFALFVLCTRNHDEVRLPHDVTFVTSVSRPGAVLSVQGSEFHIFVHVLYL